MQWLLSAVWLLAGVVMAQELPWWKTATLYQVYPRSFKDSDGDGVGDLKGIIEKAEYLKEIGVTAIWLSPLFKSPLADFGYDISDYRNVDPIFGSDQDLKDLSQKLNSLGIKMLLDFVPNHTSDEHEWFKKSVKKIDPYTDYYVWNDGKLDPKTNKRVPPNNWLSVFSGPAWEWNEERQQFYLHQFLKKQPDLDFRNPLVVKEMDDIIRFWLDYGVDGFRVDAVPYLFEDKELRDEKPLKGTSGKNFKDLNHTRTENQPENHGLLDHWADVVYGYTLRDGRPRAMYLEAYADLPTTIKYYGHGTRDFMIPFNFQLQTNGNQSTRPAQLKQIIYSFIDKTTQGEVITWVVGNHDRPRVADMKGPEMVDSYNLLTFVLPGVKVTYYGEEIGMCDTFIRWDQTVDPRGLLVGKSLYIGESRDPERTPLQWDDSVSAGFSTNKTTWLPVNPNYWWLNIKAQDAAEVSHLKVFKTMAAARKDPVLLNGALKVEVPDEDTLVVIRSYNEAYIVFIFNMGSEIADYTSDNFFGPLDLDMDWSVIVASVNSGIKSGQVYNEGSTDVSLRPGASVVLKSN